MTDRDIFHLAALQGVSVGNETVIDIHGHCAGLSEPYGVAPRTWPLSAQVLLGAIGQIGVAHLVFSHFDALRATNSSEFVAALHETEDIVQHAAGRFSAHLVLHPYFAAFALAQLERTGDDSIYVGTKLHGELHDVRAASSHVVPLLERCEELGLSVLMHVHPADSPADLGNLVGRFPRLNFVLAHLWPAREGGAALFREHANLFTDTSLSYGAPGTIERMIETLGPTRVLYGSDSNYLSMGGQFSKVACTTLPVDIKRQVFAANACAAFPRLARKLTASQRPPQHSTPSP